MNKPAFRKNYLSLQRIAPGVVNASTEQAVYRSVGANDQFQYRIERLDESRVRVGTYRDQGGFYTADPALTVLVDHAAEAARVVAVDVDVLDGSYFKPIHQNFPRLITDREYGAEYRANVALTRWLDDISDTMIRASGFFR